VVQVNSEYSSSTALQTQRNYDFNVNVYNRFRRIKCIHSRRITYLENGIHLCLFELMPFSISPDYTQDGRLHSSHCPIIFGDRCCGYLAVPCHLLYSVQLTIQLSTLYLLKRGGVATCNTLGRNISLLQIELPILLWNKLVGYSLRTLH
jgi:hypothetical protein